MFPIGQNHSTHNIGIDLLQKMSKELDWQCYMVKKKIFFITPTPIAVHKGAKWPFLFRLWWGKYLLKIFTKLEVFIHHELTCSWTEHWTGKNIVYFKNGEYENDVLQTISNHKSLIQVHLCAVDWAATRVENE
jgi:hypothetical protein